jgi:hypothetical protein
VPGEVGKPEGLLEKGFLLRLAALEVAEESQSQGEIGVERIAGALFGEDGFGPSEVKIFELLPELRRQGRGLEPVEVKIPLILTRHPGSVEIWDGFNALAK